VLVVRIVLNYTLHSHSPALRGARILGGYVAALEGAAGLRPRPRRARIAAGDADLGGARRRGEAWRGPFVGFGLGLGMGVRPVPALALRRLKTTLSPNKLFFAIILAPICNRVVC
jgi:hypothetical protein